ncbi:MAG: c-type cytochrome [Paracoccaceae bacterium]
MGATKILALAGFSAVLAFGGAAAQERIADDFDLEETVAVCAACHGEDGVPVEADIPILWGQQFYYLYVQMKDYKAGRRANEVMQPMVEGFTRDQMKALATYFSERPWPDIPNERDSAKAGHGRSQAAAGQCAQCHNKYLGDSRVPRVAGQQEAYLLRTMLEFKHKVRLNSPAKGSLLNSFEDSGIEEIAHFLATL